MPYVPQSAEDDAVLERRLSTEQAQLLLLLLLRRRRLPLLPLPVSVAVFVAAAVRPLLRSLGPLRLSLEALEDEVLGYFLQHTPECGYVRRRGCVPRFRLQQ